MTLSLNPSLQAWLNQAWKTAHGTDLPTQGWSACPRPEVADFTHTAALTSARALGKPPRAVAQAWLDALPPHPFVAAADVVGPGHLNVKLSPAGWQALLEQPAAAFDTPSPPPPTLVEFVSANPTGPLHLGHARQAVLGDVIARLLRRLGGQVATEFFYNDAGAQIDKLEQSVRLRAKELGGATLVFERDGATAEQAAAQKALLFPADGYHGDYIVDVARAWLDQGSEASDPGLREFAIATLQADQQADLEALGVVFDGRVSERSLHEQGKVATTVAALKPFAYQAYQAHQDVSLPEPGAQLAWFLETSRWGDDKDRVMVKADGSVTYFVPDVAYHLDKWARGWKQAINLQGSDHHGTLARVQAGVQAIVPAIGPDYPKVIFHTMIKVMKGGQPVKASKRAGDYLTMREVMDQVGVDAFRLAMLEKKPESPVTLDVDVWLAQNATNPVYAIQYAHARLCKTLDKVAEEPVGMVHQIEWLPSEKALMIQLAVLDDRLNTAAQDLEPARVALIAKELAAAVNEAYQQGPKVLALDAPSRALRVQLFQAAVSGLKNVGGVLGIDCPDRMPEKSPARSPGL
jgi:arginyl-tRNA synthetase